MYLNHMPLCALLKNRKKKKRERKAITKVMALADSNVDQMLCCFFYHVE